MLNKKHFVLWLAGAALLLFSSNQTTFSKDTDAKDAAKNAGEVLFNGKTLENWKATNFAGGGKALVEDGTMILRFGEALTGVNYTKEVPTSNYEVTLEAQRVDGSDFFCGLTFPVGKEHASLIVGGWGGGVIGISSIDSFDAAENETTRYEKFENKKWYKIRLRVTDAKIEAWIGDKKQVDLERAKRKFSLRMEIEDSSPFGLASYQSTAAIKNIRLVKLDTKDKVTAKKEAVVKKETPAKEVAPAKKEAPAKEKVAVKKEEAEAKKEVVAKEKVMPKKEAAAKKEPVAKKEVVVKKEQPAEKAVPSSSPSDIVVEAPKPVEVKKEKKVADVKKAAPKKAASKKETPIAKAATTKPAAKTATAAACCKCQPSTCCKKCKCCRRCRRSRRCCR